MNTDERTRILTMLKEGRTTVEEAGELLEALEPRTSSSLIRPMVLEPVIEKIVTWDARWGKFLQVVLFVGYIVWLGALGMRSLDNTNMWMVTALWAALGVVWDTKIRLSRVIGKLMREQERT